MELLVSWLAALFVFCSSVAAAPVPNMNGDYILSPTPGSGDLSRFPTNFADYPGGVEYFDVYSHPIKTLYSQVYYKVQDPVELPKEIVQRFAGKGMALVGYETDQVRRTPEGDVSVPINVAYNHHFTFYLMGANTSLEQIPRSDPRAAHHSSSMKHGSSDPNYVWMPVNKNHQDMSSSSPFQQSFQAAEGGEYRKSFRGFPPGYAVVIGSPERVYIAPMMIDTWNRERMNLTGSPFVPGPVPRNNLAPLSGPDAIYSGLLECPLTTRVQKRVIGNYFGVMDGSTCGEDKTIDTAQECWSAGQELFGNQSFVGLIDDAKQPSGCIGVQNSSGVYVLFNTKKKQQQKEAEQSSASVPCGHAGVSKTSGYTQSLVGLGISIDADADEVVINITGPSDVWFGVGFHASVMFDTPWAVIVDGDGQVTERQLGRHNPGSLLPPMCKLVSHFVNGSLRTVTLTRPLKGAGPQYFTFKPSSDLILPFINAVGSSKELSYHKVRTASSIALLPLDTSVCVCAEAPAPFGQAKGYFVYEDGNQVGFDNTCYPEPVGDLLVQKNPTCDIRTYAGGMLVCGHMWSLLDHDQEIPWADQPLEYYLKFRFWFQEYKPSRHQMVQQGGAAFASPIEYDIPQTASGNHTIQGTYVMMPAAKNKSISLVAAHFHCHAPACLSIALYNNHTGELICEQKPVYGEDPRTDPKFSEPGYIFQPPCLWGDAKFGLAPPPDVGGLVLQAVKISNSTYGHHGEMAYLRFYTVEEPLRG